MHSIVSIKGVNRLDMQPNAKGKTPLDYLSAVAQKLMGRTQPEGVMAETITEEAQVIDKKAVEVFSYYNVEKLRVISE